MRSALLASGINPDGKDTDKLPKWPSEMTDKSPEELVALYVGQTPLYSFFSTRLPFTVPQRFRFEHTHIVGGSGHGKTQLLQTLILQDVARLAEGKASVIVIDSQGDMIRKIQQLQTTDQIADRVVIIDPTEIDAPPALNLFDFGLERAHSYNALEREMLVNGAISLYEYVFGALLGAELTARQGVIFRYLAHLLMVVPDATIHTLIDFMEEPEKIAPYIGKLEGSARRFFETQFLSRFFNDTRQQILTRIYGVLATGVLDRMFSHKRNKVNLFAEMNRGSLILINTAKDLLKQEGTEILGRFFIALICQAAQERASIPEDKRMPTFVYIDEAHDYFDESMENLFNQARKYAVGLCVAHQNLDQFEQYLRATVMTSTAIKLVGGLSSHDASAFAKDMHTEPEFLLSMRKHDSETQFACFVRNLTERPIPLSIPFGTMEGQPKLSAQAIQTLRAQNRQRYSVVADEAAVPTVEVQQQYPAGEEPTQPATTPRKRELL
jgi:Type IV secretion-system coupling protein DNA-binding domain